MKYYFTTRHASVVLAVGLGIDLLLLVFQRPLVIYQESGILTFTPGTPLQIAVVGALTLGLSSRSEQFEFPGVRSLKLLRLINATALVSCGIVGAVVISVVTDATSPETLSVGMFAPLRAFLGLMGAALGVIAFTDMRLGALCALPFVLLPAAFDLQALPVGAVLGFVLADAADAAAWWTVVALLSTGLALYALGYSERNSPSINRRTIIDSRSRRRMRSAVE